MKKLVVKKMKKEKSSKVKPLTVRHRPESFKGVLGQDKIVGAIKSKISKGDLARTILLCGPRGTGKTTIARIIAKLVGAKGRDIVEYDIAHMGGVDKAREISENSKYSPFESQFKVYIFDECHRASKAFFDALLKPTEEPPSHMYYIFCTTEPEKLTSTITSRCTIYKLSKLKPADIKNVLESILKKEKQTISNKVLRDIMYHSEGDCRTAINMLGMLLGVEDPDLDSLIPIMDKKAFKDLSRSLLEGKGWKIIREKLKALEGEDPERIRLGVYGYMGATLMNGDNLRAFVIMQAFKEPFYSNGRHGLTYACYLATKGS